MAHCPFCRQSVNDSLLRFGGHCPKCLIEIPGEETPTDPGQKSTATEVLEIRQAEMKQGHFGFIFTLVIIVGLAAGGFGWKMRQDRLLAEREAAVAASEFDFYITPLESVPVPNATNPASETTGDNADAPKTPGNAVASSNSSSNTAGSRGSRGPRVLDLRGSADDLVSAPALSEDLEVSKPVLQIGSTVTIGRKEVSESLALSDPEEIKQSVKMALTRYRSQVDSCYNLRVKAMPSLKGRWVVKMTILQNGRTSNVAVSGLDSSDQTLEDCIGARARSWVFRPLALSQTLEIPFNLVHAN